MSEQQFVAPIREMETLRLLHIRQSGKFLRGLRGMRGFIHSQMNPNVPCSELIITANQHCRYNNGLVDRRSCWEQQNLLNNLDVTREIIQDITNFSDWVFGRNGIPSLQVLAYGDFSPSATCEDCFMLMCRDSTARNFNAQLQGYRIMTKNDRMFRSFMADNKIFLASCPAA